MVLFPYSLFNMDKLAQCWQTGFVTVNSGFAMEIHELLHSHKDFWRSANCMP